MSRDNTLLSNTPTCKWDRAWSGKCELPATINGCCADHQKLCGSCGSPATHDCDETGQFVCGASLCDDCEHTIYEDGTNGGVGFNARRPPAGMQYHCRKAEQRYKSWMAQELESRPAFIANALETLNSARKSIAELNTHWPEALEVAGKVFIGLKNLEQDLLEITATIEERFPETPIERTESV